MNGVLRSENRKKGCEGRQERGRIVGGKTRQIKTIHKTRQDNKRQNKTRQDKTRQDNTTQHNTTQGKTRQSNIQ